jgi:saccharopine dehydrogenase-like NADP-dependent oxidoreductase
MKNVAVLGLGKIGTLACELLHEAGFSVQAFDLRTPSVALPFPVKTLDVTNPDAIATVFAGVDAVLSCLPYNLNLPLAEAACAANIHYFDLTEDVPTTRGILELSKTANTLMAPQWACAGLHWHCGGQPD